MCAVARAVRPRAAVIAVGAEGAAGCCGICGCLCLWASKMGRCVRRQGDAGSFGVRAGDPFVKLQVGGCLAVCPDAMRVVTKVVCSVRYCGRCGGEGRSRMLRHVRVFVPVGVQDGQVL